MHNPLYVSVISYLVLPFAVVGGLIALPIFGGLKIKEKVDTSKFKEDSSEFFYKWLKDALNGVQKRKSINVMIRGGYLLPIESIIDNMSDRIVPLSMKAKRVLLDVLLNNTSSSKKIVAKYAPVLTSVQDYIVNVRLFHVKFLAKDTFSFAKIANLAKVTSGHCADVYSAKYVEFDVTIRVVNARSCHLLSHIDHLKM
ncbi:hypothetical protein DPMN_155815 [Dreissena polymorpha]|uniref:Uncharacterized protein n=1 Tax=Dreissena polymorpha TaxID=45954 RepID=A0A9D4JA99_DREPO|nr:hypothetical protein DPMN_155815 [Dreissena polymorpha]